MNRTIILILLIPFTILTAVALWNDGVLGILTSITSSYGSLQIYVDLVIALILILAWMWRDAKATGRNIWPWIITTLLIGSFGPLIYLLTRNSTDAVE